MVRQAHFVYCFVACRLAFGASFLIHPETYKNYHPVRLRIAYILSPILGLSDRPLNTPLFLLLLDLLSPQLATLIKRKFFSFDDF